MTFDCADLTFMDSTCLAVMAEAVAYTDERGGKVQVSNTPEVARRMFKVCGLTDLVQVT